MLARSPHPSVQGTRTQVDMRKHPEPKGGWRYLVAIIGGGVTGRRTVPIWAIPLHFLLASWKECLCQHTTLLREP